MRCELNCPRGKVENVDEYEVLRGWRTDTFGVLYDIEDSDGLQNEL